MATTDSGAWRPFNPTDADHILREIGLGGRHGSEWVVAIGRNQSGVK
jgi:hypothetical protein